MSIITHSAPLTALHLLALALLMLCAGGCQSDSKTTATAPPTTTSTPSGDALFGRWLLVALGDQTIAITPPISLLIDAKGTVSGRSAVNGYSGAVAIEELGSGAFELSPLASTMMAGPPERMELEARYFKALGNVKRWRIEAGALQLTDGVNTLARFKSAPGG